MKIAFTLVELIVVITILAILGTIAFISLQGYSKEARDSKRIQDVRSLLTKLNVENVKGTPYADMLLIKDSYDKKIGGEDKPVNMGTLDFEYLRENPNNFKDPEYKTDYDFATAIGEAKYEGKDQSYNFIQGRYWSEKSNQEVIMGNYYKYETGDAEDLFSGSINTNKPPLGPGVFPDGNDLIVSDGQGNIITIKNKNEGATIEFTDLSQCTTVSCPTSVAGKYYQWGRNIAFDAEKTITEINGDSNTRVPIDFSDKEINIDFIWNNDGFTIPNNRYDWSKTREDNAWTGINIQGPCSAGYHIPTQTEWHRLVEIWLKSKNISLASNNTIHDWSANEEIFKEFQTKLQIPLAGSFAWYNGLEYDQGVHANYWSSSPYNSSSYYLYFGVANINTSPNNDRAVGFSVRCFKN